MLLPLLVERLIFGLEIECHGAEAGPFEVEVEILVVLLLALLRFLSLRRGVFYSLLTALDLFYSIIFLFIDTPG